jgi:hypothetical protein
MKTTTMRYYDAIHAQLDALTTWRKVMMVADADNVPKGYVAVDQSIKDKAIHLLERADPYFLDGEIQEWILNSMDSFPQDVCIGDVLPPSHRGWLLLEHPIDFHITDSDNVTRIDENMAAIAWSTIDGHRWDEQQDEPLVWIDFYDLNDGDFRLTKAMVWAFHKSIYDIVSEKELSVGKELPYSDGYTFILSLFAFMNQPFSTVDSRRLPRGERRRLQRETGLEDPKINVIALRRAKYAKGQSNGGLPEGSSREWTSRWIVKGHWRNQYYPSKQKNSALWIMPYVKGPEDKPLKARNDVSLFHVTR